MATLGDGAKVFLVVVAVNGADLRVRLARMGGVSCIGLRRELRDQAGLVLGDTYGATVTRDDAERVIEVLDDLAAALAEAGQRGRFNALAPT